MEKYIYLPTLTTVRSPKEMFEERKRKEDELVPDTYENNK